MQTINKRYSEINTGYDIAKLQDPEKLLYIDIETTGFSAQTSICYLIGCAYFNGLSFENKQFFADKPEEEETIIREFMEFASNFTTLIHFNGNNFDIPYLEYKCQKYNIDFVLAKMEGIDLYKRISPYKSFLKIPNCKQKTIEQYLGIDREDVLSGGDLIGIYKDYVKKFDPSALANLLLHNSDDILGMIMITGILSYSDLFNEKITVTKVTMDKYNNINGEECIELIMKLQLPTSLPSPITHMTYNCYFKAEGNEGLLKVPVFNTELKYFYANYKDYYYLPMEDVALHKSVSGFVEKEYRTQATAHNCYTRVTSLFLPQFDKVFDPFYKSDYQSKDIYFELTNERKKDREFFSQYVSHILNTIILFS